MAQSKEIQIFNIAKTGMNKHAVRDWLDSVGAVEYPVPVTKDQYMDTDNGPVWCHQEVTPGAAVIGLAAKRCYMSFEPGLNPNVTKVRKDWSDYLTNILRSGHGSVLEHATYTFAIEGLTRVATAELNRHRAGVAISEGSMRYIRFDDIDYWEPLLFRSKPDDTEEEANKKRITREEFREAFAEDEQRYLRLCNLWNIDEGKFKKKKLLTSAFRRIVGMGVCTGGVWTFNVRALRHVLTMRSTPYAEEEICLVASTMAKLMLEQEPQLFGDFVIEDGYWVPKFVKV